jgi:hypothetical protein
LKIIIDYSFEKFGIWEELGELARVSAGSPFWCSDSAVKLSALAGSLEKPFRLFICRYWHRESKSFIEERISFADLGRGGIFSLARVESLGVSLSWAHPHFPCCVLSPVAELCIFKGVVSLAGRDLELAISAGYYLVGCVLLLLAVSPISRCCVLLRMLRGRQG